MEELEKNGLSMEVLEQLAYETQMEKSLKNTKQVKVGPLSANVIVLGTE